MREKICIIGGGWFGVEAAIELSESYDIVLTEKNKKIFGVISCYNGRRLNSGGHYQTSELTREGCKKGSSLFKKKYPELLVENYSFYGYTESDYDGKPSKVSKEHFLKVFEEYKNEEYQCEKINPQEWGYENLSAAVKIKEPSIISGEKLSEIFKGYLENAGVKIKYNFEVTKLEKQPNNKILVGNDKETEEFDHVINATGFMSLLPSLANLPNGMEIVYQVCLALVYKNKKPAEVPFDKFTVLDGFNPCYLPRNNDNNEYILTHAKLTNSSFSTPDEAREKLKSYEENDEYITEYVKPECEREMYKYFPEFKNLFEYLKYIGVVIPKMITQSEFRSGIVFKDLENGIIYIFPGKISDIFFIASEILSLVKNENIIKAGNYGYVKNGTFDKGMQEIQKKPQGEEVKRSTSGLKTSQEWEEKQDEKFNKLVPLASESSQANNGNGSCSPTLFKKKNSPSKKNNKRKNLTREEHTRTLRRKLVR